MIHFNIMLFITLARVNVMPAALGTNRMFVYASLGIGVLGIIMTIAAGGAFLIPAAIMIAIGTVGGVAFWKYGYIFVPFITTRANIILMNEEGIEIPPSQDVIIKHSGGVYYAATFIGLRITESMTEKSMEDTMNYTQLFERAVSNLKYVTKLSYMLFVEDIGDKRKEIEAKRAEAQLRLQRERDKSQPDPLRLDRYERDASMWDVQLQRIIKGEKPMGIVAYAQTVAVDTSKDAAVARAKAQASELRTLMANALNVEVVMLAGDEMLKCFEWERFFPASAQELEEAVA